MEEQQTVVPEEAPKTKVLDKQRLSKTDAEKAIKQLEVMHKYVKKDILDALKSKECSPGTNSRLAYLKALQQLEIDYVDQITKTTALEERRQSDQHGIHLQGPRRQGRIGADNPRGQTTASQHRTR